MENHAVIERMEKRAKAARTRAEVRAWQYRQRHHASGLWFRLRRTLVDAATAYAISTEDAAKLLREGVQPVACGKEMSPEKALFFVDEARLLSLGSRRPVRVGLGPAVLSARALALVSFPE